MSSVHALQQTPGAPLAVKEYIKPDILKLIYSGHSNGGQGAWWFTTHYPDYAMAGTPIF
jgi:hypothetical protein